MAITVTQDVFDLGGVKFSEGVNGWAMTKTFYVEGIDPNIEPWRKQHIAFLSTGVDVGDPHPSGFEPPMVVRSITVNMLTQTKAAVIVNYGSSGAPGSGTTEPPSTDPSAVVVELNAALNTVQTHYDADGVQLQVTYQEKDSAGQFIGEPTTVPATANIQRPTTVLRFQRREYLDDVPAKAAEYVGTVNSAVSDFTGGWRARSWLCTEITAAHDGSTYTDDAGATKKTAQVTYSFQRMWHETGWYTTNWDAVVVYIDPATGEPASGLDLPNNQNPSSMLNGVTLAQIYEERDFMNDLNLPRPVGF